jgi:hypothetical protein
VREKYNNKNKSTWNPGMQQRARIKKKKLVFSFNFCLFFSFVCVPPCPSPRRDPDPRPGVECMPYAHIAKLIEGGNKSREPMASPDLKPMEDVILSFFLVDFSPTF